MNVEPQRARRDGEEAPDAWRLDACRNRGGAAGRTRRAGHGEGAAHTRRAARSRRRVFERDGYLDTRVADIAAAAKLAHGSFYTYFSSKQEVFLAIVRDVGEQIRDAVAPSPADAELDAYEALDRSNRRYLEVYRANSVIWALVEQVATIDPEIHRIRLLGRRLHVERVAKTIRRWQERGMADRGIDPARLPGRWSRCCRTSHTGGSRGATPTTPRWWSRR